ncbi:MAG: hypothetical protein WBM74_19145, partial [Polyangiales bacterium]
MRPVSEQPPADAIDDDHLAAKLTERSSDSLEVRTIDAGHSVRPEQEATPPGLTVGVVNGVDRD